MKNAIPFPKAKTEWFQIKNATEESADVFIYDVVGDSWVGGDAATVVKAINGIKAKKINLRINSPGGSVFDGVAIYNALARHSAEVTTYVDGLAASIASIIALAGKKIVMAENAMMMIHNPWTYTAGDSASLRKEADVLDQVRETLINTYATRTGKERDVIGAALDAETWFTAQEAKDWGLNDEITLGVKAMACADSDTLSSLGINKAPTAVIQQDAPLSSIAPRSLHQRKQALLEKIST